MTVPKRSQAFQERQGTPPFPAFPSVPPLKGGGNVGNAWAGQGGWQRIGALAAGLITIVSQKADRT